MKSIKRVIGQRLLWKIIIIFWLTTVCTILANIYITKEIALSEFKSEQFSSLTQDLANQAVRTYEQEGQKALRKWYRQVFHKEGLRLVLLNSELEKLGVRGGNEGTLFFPTSEGFKDHILSLADQDVTSSSNKNYVLRILPSPALRSKFNPEHLHFYRFLASFFIIFFGSFYLARSISVPLNILQQASQQLSEGNFSIRTREKIGSRKDELGQFAKAFDQMAEQIEALLSNQKRIFRDISHEIRTPLTRQKLAIELAKESKNPQEFLEKIEHQNEQIDKLIHQLLTLIKLEDTAIFQNETIDLNELLCHVISEAELDIQTKNLHVSIQSDSDCLVEGSQILLQSAFENILVNAIKYSPEKARVAIAINTLKNKIKVSVLDEGPGIPEEDLKHIDKPFYRSDQSRNKLTGGFGLGLAITKKIIHQHQATLAIHNRQPCGLAVIIEFLKKA